MAIVPIGLNIYDGRRLWLSHRVGGAWITELKAYDQANDSEFSSTVQEFGSGATQASQYDHLGILIEGLAGPLFLGNGGNYPVYDVSGSIPNVVPGLYNHVCGARFINNKYWYFQRTTDFGTQYFPRIVTCLSSDDGITWEESSQTNAPVLYNTQTSPSTSQGQYQDTYWDGGDIVYVFVSRPEPVDGSGGLGGQVYGFDTTSDEPWFEVTDWFSGFAYDATSLRLGFVGRYSDGTIGVAFPKTNGIPYAVGISFRYWDGASWDAAVEVDAVDSLGTVVTDPATGMMYIFKHVGGSPGELALSTVEQDGTLDDDVIVFPAAAASNGAGTGLIFENTLMVAYDYWEDNANCCFEIDLDNFPSYEKKLWEVPQIELDENEGYPVPSCASIYLSSYPIGSGPNGGGGGECVAITPSGITPAIEWDDEALEQ